MPLVSVLVSTYNSEEFIEQKINDLLNQSIVDQIEIIIINSGSQQNEEEIIKKYLKKNLNIKYISTASRESIYQAWNRGIKESNGRFITNSNTDDRLEKNALEELSNILLTNPKIALVYADQYLSYIPNQKFTEAIGNKICKFPNFNKILQLDRCLVGSQPMWRASLHFEDGYWFDESYEVSGDHEFELQVSLNYEMLHHPQVLGTFYKSKRTNKSYENLKRNEKELSRLKEKYIPLFVRRLPPKEVVKLTFEFSKLIKGPISLFLLKYWVNKFFSWNSNLNTLEFSYYFLIHLLKEQNLISEALHICNKYLKNRESELIRNEFTSLQGK